LDQSRPTVTMCRGCCCGTTRKHPGFDHDAQVTMLRDRLQGTANFRITDCLGPCERSNVLVVSPSRHGHRTGGRPTWLGSVLDETAAADITSWLCAGGPGLAPLPDTLTPYRFEKPKRQRQHTD
jgi:(2Fe-2S) ferredoxin